MLNRVRCRECFNVNRAKHRSAQRRTANGGREPGDKYVPIEQILDVPRIRILRALRWFDWATTETLFDVLDVPTSKAERDRFAVTLSRASRSGDIEKRRTFGPCEFRTTAAGLATIQRACADYDQRLGEGVAA